MRTGSGVRPGASLRAALTVGALLVATALGLSACTADAEPAASDPVATRFAANTTMAKLRDAGTIRIGIGTAQPLFGSAGEGKAPTGFDVEIAELVASKLGIAADKISWVPTTASAAASLLTESKADLVIDTLPITDAAKATISFAGPYFTGGQDIVVAAGNPKGIEGPEDLRGKTVCSIAGSSFASTIAGYGVSLKAAASYPDCLAALTAGSVVAVTGDDVALGSLVASGGAKFTLLGNRFTAQTYGIGVGLKDAKFRGFVNDVLEESFGDGTWQRLWDSTAGKVLGSQKPPILDRY
jgi:glutamate transport system substrate-binding protein